MTSSVLAQGPEPLAEQGNDQFNRQNFAEAAKLYDELLTKYPTFALRDSIRLQLGRAYIFSGQFAKAVEAMTPLLETGRNPEVAAAAQYYIPLAQLFTGAQPGLPEAEMKDLVTKAAEGFTKYLEKDGDFKQDALYYRGLAYVQLQDWSKAQSDLQTMVNTYRSSSSHPEYLYRLGMAHSGEAQQLLRKEETFPQARAKVEQAVKVFDEVSPEKSEVVSNQAQFAKANLLFVFANLTRDKEMLPDVLEEYRFVRSRNEMLPLIQKDLTALELANRAAVQRNDQRTMNEISERRSRLLSRKEELEEGDDPAIRAYLQMGQSFQSMGQFDEARLLFRRIEPFVQDDLQKQVSIEVIKTLALQGKVKQADKGLDAFLQKYPGDPLAESVSFFIGNALLEDQKYQEAILQFERSLKDYPEGPTAINASLGKAAALVQLGRADEAAGVLETLSTSKAGTELGAQADFNIGEAYMGEQKFAKAVEAYQRVLDNPKGTGFREAALIKKGLALLTAGENEKAIEVYRDYLKEYPDNENAPTAYYYIVLAQDRLGQKADAEATVAELVAKFPDNKLAPFALFYQGNNMYARDPAKQQASFKTLFTKFPDAPQVPQARGTLAKFFQTEQDYDKAAEQYREIEKLGNPAMSAFALTALGAMRYQQADAMGNYPVFTEAQKKEFQDYLLKSEEAFLDVGIKYPETDRLTNAISGLTQVAKLRRKFDIISDAEMLRFFDEKAAVMKDPNARTQLELAKAAWPYEQGDFGTAMVIYSEVLGKNPQVSLGADDSKRYGDLLIRDGKADEAVALFEDLKARTPSNQIRTLWEIDYGLGMAFLAKEDYPHAKQHLQKFESDPQYVHYPNRDDALIGLGTIYANEGDATKAKATLGKIANSPHSRGLAKAKALMAMAKVLEKEGANVPDPKDTARLNAVACYMRAEILIGLSHKELAKRCLLEAQRLYRAAGNTQEVASLQQRIDSQYAGVTAAPAA